MVVYLEYAFAENFMLDVLLLHLALACARTERRPLRLLLGGAVGGAEALLFPLLSLPVWAAYAVKIAGGAVLPVLSVRKGTAKTYAIAVAAFFFLTFALGGLLTALYSFFGVEYVEGSGYLVESAPVGLIFAAAGIFFIAAVCGIKKFFRFGKTESVLVPCILEGVRTVNWRGLSDSGNSLEFMGKPACVLSAAGAYALLGREAKEAGRMEVGTVNGARVSPVYLCPRMKIGDKVFEDVPLAVGNLPCGTYQIILHTAYTEAYHGTFGCAQKAASKDKGERKRHPLSLRKRGSAPPAFERGGGGTSLQIGGGRGDGAGEGSAHRA